MIEDARLVIRSFGHSKVAVFECPVCMKEHRVVVGGHPGSPPLRYQLSGTPMKPTINPEVLTPWVDAHGNEGFCAIRIIDGDGFPLGTTVNPKWASLEEIGDKGITLALVNPKYGGANW